MQGDVITGAHPVVGRMGGSWALPASQPPILISSWRMPHPSTSFLRHCHYLPSTGERKGCFDYWQVVWHGTKHAPTVWWAVFWFCAQPPFPIGSLVSPFIQPCLAWTARSSRGVNGG